MKVLFLSQIVPYPPHGGVLQRGYNLIRELGREAQVHLLAFVHPDVLPTPAALEESRKALGAFCEKVEYFPLWPKASKAHQALGLAMSAVSSQPFSVIAHRSAAYQRRIDTALAATPFDIVHADTVALSQFVRPDVRVPSVLTHHNIESMLMERRAKVEKGWLARRFLDREAAKLRLYEAAESPRFDVNVVVSAPDGEALAEIAPGLRTAVVPNGVDVDYFSPQPDRETPALVYTGGMNMFANRDAVMSFCAEVWPLITASVPDVTFFAVGQDPPPELRALSARDNRIVVTGFVDDIRPYVSKAAVYVVPLRVGGGTRLKVLDAMAMGKALVSTSIGCEGIAVRPDEHLVIGDTPEAMAAATIALLKDPVRRRALGSAARGLVEQRYAWRVVGRQLLDAYQEATTRQRRAS
ncbi:MAG: glycosyltransferase [Vicinamibacteraceae bacterium]